MYIHQIRVKVINDLDSTLLSNSWQSRKPFPILVHVYPPDSIDNNYETKPHLFSLKKKSHLCRRNSQCLLIGIIPHYLWKKIYVCELMFIHIYVCRILHIRILLHLNSDRNLNAILWGLRSRKTSTSKKYATLKPQKKTSPQPQFFKTSNLMSNLKKTSKNLTLLMFWS